LDALTGRDGIRQGQEGLDDIALAQSMEMQGVVESSPDSGSGSRELAGSSSTCFPSPRRNAVHPMYDVDAQEYNFIGRQSGESATFRLSPRFVTTYREQTPPFGFNGLGELVY